MGKLIKPGDVEYNQYVESGGVRDEDLKILTEGVELGKSSIAVEFETRLMRHGEVEYGVIEITPVTSKIIFHFKGVPRNLMYELSTFFMDEVRKKIITGSDLEAGGILECGENPLMRNHWDVTILNINKFSAPGKMRLILQKLLQEFPR